MRPEGKDGQPVHRETAERQAAQQASAHDHQDSGLAEDEYRILHEEVERLPEKYRAPVVLCYFEGLTHDAAADALRWPLGTVRGRLARARDELRRRLTAQGAAPAAAVSLLTVESVSAETAFTSGLLRSTVAMAADAAAPSAVATLAGSMLRGLMLGRLRRTLALLCVALAVGGAGVAVVSALASHSGNPQSPPILLAAQPARRSSDSTRSDLQGDPLPEGATVRLGSTRFNHGSLVDSIAYSPDGFTLASVSWDHTVRLWDVKTGRVLREIGFDEDNAYCIAFAPDGKTMAIGIMGKEGKVILIDVQSGKELQRSEPYKGSAWRIAMSPDGTLIATTDANAREVILWDAATLKPRRKIATSSAGNLGRGVHRRREGGCDRGQRHGLADRGCGPRRRLDRAVRGDLGQGNQAGCLSRTLTSPRWRLLMTEAGWRWAAATERSGSSNWQQAIRSSRSILRPK